jgi:hypothetical protein
LLLALLLRQTLLLLLLALPFESLLDLLLSLRVPTLLLNCTLLLTRLFRRTLLLIWLASLSIWLVPLLLRRLVLAMMSTFLRTGYYARAEQQG